jgi:hypothetical protein
MKLCYKNEDKKYYFSQNVQNQFFIREMDFKNTHFLKNILKIQYLK